MGGCRCTYRNCSSRTDGKTHMFHYPVFDKVRCHQWLTNAHKLEFLNLKVSQLKNRVVCQHHFKDDCFMNFLKDKLTFDAVPTEDGPYCDSSQLGGTKPEQDESKVFSISLDDIENEYLTLGDKKANFSVKYGDFLTNCDLMDMDSLNSLNQINENNQIAIKGLCDLESIPNVPKVSVSTKRPIKTLRPLTRRNRGKRFGESNYSILKNSTTKRDTLIKDNLTINHDNTVDISQLIKTPQTKKSKEPLNIVLNVSHVPIEFESSKSNDRTHSNLDQPKLLNDQAMGERAFDESRLLNQSLDVQTFDQSKPSNDQLNEVRAFEEPKLLNDQSIIDLRAFDETNLLNNQTLDVVKEYEPKILNENADKSLLQDREQIRNVSAFNNAGKSLLKEKKKIRIISEKKISEPLPLPGKLEPVSPTRILCLPNKRKFCKPNPLVEIPEVPINSAVENTVATNSSKYNVVLERPEIEPMNITSIRRDNISHQKILNNVVNSIPDQVLSNSACPQRAGDVLLNKSSDKDSPKTSLLKSKIPPERVAAIAEKRKFNMKLRDIIEDCLDKLDGPDTSDLDKRKTKTMQSKNQQIGSYLAKNPELPSVQDYTIAYLEARMKKMENNLLNKIEENSQKIVDLKQTYAPSCGKKNVHTQTSISEDVHKRQLYQELSKYLSPEANSLVYEELFINKYTKDVVQGSPSIKRRKRR